MVGCHHQLKGHEFGHTLGDSLKARKPGVLQSMGSQRIRHDLVTKQKQQHKDLGFIFKVCVFFFFKGTIFKVFIKFVTVSLLFYVLIFWL